MSPTRRPNPVLSNPPAPDPSSRLPAAARALLARLPCATAPAAAAALLLARGLARRASDGRLLATEEGEARRRRMAAPPGLAFLAQHTPLEIGDLHEPGEPVRAVLRDAAESPLAWLARRTGRDGRPLVDAVALRAGERLRVDLTAAAMLPRVTADWSGLAAGTGGGAPAAAADAALSARQRVRRALVAVGPDLSGLLVDVCGFLKGLEQVEKERAWPARSAKVVLGIALARLAAHYGDSREIRGPATSQGIRAWSIPAGDADGADGAGSAGTDGRDGA
ncbi:MAG: DUF6456 domain-containing protein [Alsobacter sp.]